MQDDPSQARFVFELGRAAQRLGQAVEAVRDDRLAAERGHAAAFTALAFAMTEGTGVPNDLAMSAAHDRRGQLPERTHQRRIGDYPASAEAP